MSIATSQDQKAETRSSIRIALDGRWDTTGFSAFFDALTAVATFFDFSVIYGVGPPEIPFSPIASKTLLQGWDAWRSEASLEVSRLLAFGESDFRELDAHALALASSKNLSDLYALFSLAKAADLIEYVLTKAKVHRDHRRVSEHRRKLLPWDSPLDEWLSQGDGHYPSFSLLDMRTYGALPWLDVERIRFGSPGFVDIAGLGAIVGHLKDFLSELIQISDRKRTSAATVRKLEAEARLIEAQAQDIEVKTLLHRLEQLRSLGLPAEQLVVLAIAADRETDTLLRYIDLGRIVGVASTPPDSEADLRE